VSVCAFPSWPIHVAPQPDELLSSWIVRLAHAHRITCETLVSHAFQVRFPIWNRDIDRSATLSVLERLAQVSGISIEQLRQCTMEDLIPRFSRSPNPHGVTSGVLPLGIFHRTRLKRGLMYCRGCLAEDTVAYFRRAWRVSYHTVCLRHGHYLEDSCGACGNPVVPHRADMRWGPSPPGARLHVRCCTCGADLRAGDSMIASEAAVEVAARIHTAIDEGVVPLGDGTVDGPAFLDGLRMLTYVQRGILGLEAGRQFEHWSIGLRRDAIAALANWLANWPDAFVADASAKRVSLTSVLAPSRREVPYWLAHVLRGTMLVKHAPAQPEEAEWLLRSLEAVGQSPSRAAVRRTYHRDISQTNISRQWIGEVSADAYELLLAHVDHQIGATFDAKTRNALLADKVWIALSHTYGLSMRRLSKLTVGDIQSMSLGRVRKIARAPQTCEESRGWLRWYLETVRPSLGPNPPEAPAFPSLDGVRSISANGLSMRFRKHLLRADLHRQIWSFEKLRGDSSGAAS
jgi:hypothetical protein